MSNHQSELELVDLRDSRFVCQSSLGPVVFLFLVYFC